jgi:hypothetical protein
MVFTEEEVGIIPSITRKGQEIVSGVASLFTGQPVQPVYAPSVEGKGGIQQPVEYGADLLAYGAEVLDPAAAAVTEAVASGVEVTVTSPPIWPWVVGGGLLIVGVVALGSYALSRGKE